MAKRIVSDAKLDYPAACNAMVRELLPSLEILVMQVGFLISPDSFHLLFPSSSQETLLVHKDLEQNAVLNELIFVLQNNGRMSQLFVGLL